MLPDIHDVNERLGLVFSRLSFHTSSSPVFRRNRFCIEPSKSSASVSLILRKTDMSLSGSAAEGMSSRVNLPSTYLSRLDSIMLIVSEDYNKTGDAALHYDEPEGPGATL